MDQVLEIGGYAAGYCGRLFAHAGAVVSRVTVAQGCDPFNTAPAWAGDEAMELYLHGGKQRICLDDLGQLGALAAAADIVVCDAATATDIERLGFDDWAAPVRVAITPFGRTGPKRNWRATPNVILAMAGYTQLMGDPERAPLNLPGHYLEFQVGAFAHAAANACRFAGEANVIDLAMLETLMTLSQFTTVRWHCMGEIRTRHGSDFWYVEPSDLFVCADGWVYLNILPAFWDPFTVFLDLPELLLDERFASNDLRMENRAALSAVTARAIAGMSTAEISQRAEDCRIPVGIVSTFDEVLSDPHLAERGFFEEVKNTRGRTLRSPGVPYRLREAK